MEKTTHSQQRKSYGTLIIDPPFETGQRGTYGAIKHYPLLSVEAVKRMPIDSLTTPDSHVWLWVSNQTLRIGYDVLEAWGYQVKSVFTWCKPRLGLGVYLRNGTEHALLGVRGHTPVKFKAQLNWGIFPVQDHSHKPEEFHKIVERVSPGPYAELFARRKMAGWDVWGDQVESDFQIKGFPVPKYSAKATGEEEKEADAK